MFGACVLNFPIGKKVYYIVISQNINNFITSNVILSQNINNFITCNVVLSQSLYAFRTAFVILQNYFSYSVVVLNLRLGAHNQLKTGVNFFKHIITTDN